MAVSYNVVVANPVVLSVKQNIGNTRDFGEFVAKINEIIDAIFLS